MSRRPRCSSAALVAALVLASAAAPAIASPGPGVATYRDIVESGTAAFVAGRFDDARAAFEAAFGIHPDPVLVFNIASCWRRSGNTAEALAEYHRFLSLAPAGDARRPLAVETIASLEQAAQGEPEVTPEVTIEDAAPLAVAQVAAPAPAPAPHRSRLRPIGLGITAVGAAGLLVGAAELLHASALFEAAPAPSTTPQPQPQPAPQPAPEDESGPPPKKNGGTGTPTTTAPAPVSMPVAAPDRVSRGAILLGISGAALLAAGVTIYYLGRRAERRELRLAVSGSGEGAAVLLGGRF